MRKGNYSRTYLGIAYYPDDPRIEDIRDIAYSLARQIRFNGHHSKQISVAEHCIRGAEVAHDSYKLEMLMHDAVEAYVSDMIRPLKYLPQVEPIWRALERKNELLIAKKYSLQYPYSANVHHLDAALCAREMEYSHVMKQDAPNVSAPAEVDYAFLDAPDAENLFLRTFMRLYGERVDLTQAEVREMIFTDL